MWSLAELMQRHQMEPRQAARHLVEGVKGQVMTVPAEPEDGMKPANGLSHRDHDIGSEPQPSPPMTPPMSRSKSSTGKEKGTPASSGSSSSSPEEAALRRLLPFLLSSDPQQFSLALLCLASNHSLLLSLQHHLLAPASVEAMATEEWNTLCERMKVAMRLGHHQQHIEAVRASMSLSGLSLPGAGQTQPQPQAHWHSEMSTRQSLLESLQELERAERNRAARKAVSTDNSLGGREQVTEPLGPWSNICGYHSVPDGAGESSAALRPSEAVISAASGASRILAVAAPPLQPPPQSVEGRDSLALRLKRLSEALATPPRATRRKTSHAVVTPACTPADPTSISCRSKEEGRPSAVPPLSATAATVSTDTAAAAPELTGQEAAHLDCWSNASEGEKQSVEERDVTSGNASTPTRSYGARARAVRAAEGSRMRRKRKERKVVKGTMTTALERFTVVRRERQPLMLFGVAHL